VFLLPPGKHEIYVRDPTTPVLGKHIGIIPVGEPAVITTKGLEWDVENWETKFGGRMSTSNWVKDDIIEVETSSTVLFSIDLNFPDSDHYH
jgi:thiamine pyrophosphokinase